jgi:uncharacterized protein YkwD
MHKSYCTCPRCHRGKRVKTLAIAGIAGIAVIGVVVFWGMILNTFNSVLDSVATSSPSIPLVQGQDEKPEGINNDNESTEIPSEVGEQETIENIPASETSSNSEASEATTPNTNTFDADRISLKIHDYVNEHRRDHNIAIMTYDEDLESIALGHSEDMAVNNFFDHVNLRGQDPSQRAENARYNCHKELPGGYYMEGIAENIAQNNVYESVTYISGIPFYDWKTEDELAYDIFDQWRTSLGHNENMLEATYDREGLGVFFDRDGEVHATQNFC